MAHELDFSTGKAGFAFSGSRKDIWHGLGQQIEPGDSLETIAEKAGLNFQVTKSPMYYKSGDNFIPVENTMATVRTDTGKPLGVVSDNKYNLVQPKEILEFFSDFLGSNGLSIDTAGAVKGGRIVWALAKLGPEFDFILPGNDISNSYIRLQTSFDGSWATSATPTTIRQVCANTMAMIDRQKGAHYTTRHSRTFDSSALQRALGLLGEEYKVTAEFWNTLAESKVTDDFARQFFCDLLEVKSEDLNQTVNGKSVVPTRTVNRLKALALAYKTGPGSDKPSAKGTAYGLLNAVTYFVDHEASTRDTEGEGSEVAKVYSAGFGAGAALKDKASKYLSNLVKVAA